MNQTTDIFFEVNQRLLTIASLLKQNRMLAEPFEEKAIRELQEKVNDHWRELMKQ